MVLAKLRYHGEKMTEPPIRNFRITIAVLVLALSGSLAGCPGPDDEPVWSESFDARSVGWFLSVWGTTDNNLYTVGGSPDTGAVMRFDGSTWAPVDLGLSVPLLNWVFGFGPSDITVVGRGGTIIHWDGSSWSEQTSPTTEDLWGVWGAAPNDLWAVGGRGRMDGQATLLHFDGSAWTQETLPTLERAGVNALFKVWGSSAGDVWVVGQRGGVLHYDGTTWTEELVGASEDLIAVWGTGPTNVVAVGGRGAGIVSVYNGTTWRTESLAPFPGLNGVWLNDANKAHIVGTVGSLGILDLTTFEIERSIVATDQEFHAVFSPSGNGLTAVGGNLFAQEAPYQGLAFDRSLKGSQ